MAVTAFVYLNAIAKMQNKEVDLNDGNVKVMLLTSSYTPDQDAHDYIDDANANEVVGTGYSAGGEAIANPLVTVTGATNIINFDGDNVVWSSSSITARYALVYYNTGVAATSPVLSLVDFGQDEQSVNGNFTITWDAGGIFKVTVS